MASVVENSGGTDPNANWLGFDSFKDAFTTAASTLVAYTAAKTPRAALGDDLPTNYQPVSGAQTGTSNAAVLQPGLASNLTNTLAGFAANKAIVGGVVLAVVAFVVYKVMK